MKSWKVYKSGFDYNVVAILGPQSSGKSTLLNGLFNTSFPTMVGEEGRYQCTKGIWLGQSSKSNTLVLDVEGTDGRERGDDDVAFEKKTSLFSLAIAEVLIINMWMHDVGRNNAANIPLLKTVFELNMQLFQKEKRSKTMLLFIIRDHVKESTPLNKLVAIIEKDVQEIWNGITKEDNFKNAKLSDFFDFKYTSLPHKVLKAAEFVQEMECLAERFNNPNDKDYIWTTDLKAGVPADGLAHFGEKVWEVVKENKDLNLPTQREMLALVRCDEISSTTYNAFVEKLEKGMKTMLAKKTIVEDFGARSDVLIDSALGEFNEMASRYHQEVVDRKREALKVQLLKDLKDDWNTNLALMFENSTQTFEQSIQEAFHKSEKAETPNFGGMVKKLKSDGLSEFEGLLKKTIPKTAGWDYSLVLEQLETAMDASVENEREKQLKKVLDSAGKAMERYGSSLEEVLELCKPNLWNEVRALFADIKGSGLDEIRGRLATLEISKEDLEGHMEEINTKQMTLTRKKLENFQERIVTKMEKAFDSTFKFDEQSMPRVWKPDVDLESIYKSACTSANRILELFTVLRLQEADDKLLALDEDMKIPQEKLLMSRSKIGSIQSQFKAYASNCCAEAQRGMDSYGKASGTSMIMIVLVIVLGFNEAVYFLTNPTMLFLLITVVSIGYGLHAMGMTPVILPVLKVFFNQAQTQLQSTYDQLTGATPTTPPPSSANESKKNK